MALRKDILEKKDDTLVRQKEVEAKIQNLWRWDWLEKEVDGIKLSVCFHKLAYPGKAYCSWCQTEIDYSGRGWSALKAHVKVSKHQRHAQTKKSNYSLSCKLF